MKPRKPKPSEPSLRDKLSASFMKAFQADFEMYGVEVIEQLREKHPDRYAQIATQLISSVEPKSDTWDECKDMQAVGRKLLRSVGVVDEDAITDDMVTRALAANDVFIDKLAEIAQEAIQ
jgi:hypothetical protein